MREFYHRIHKGGHGNIDIKQLGSRVERIPTVNNLEQQIYINEGILTVSNEEKKQEIRTIFF